MLRRAFPHPCATAQQPAEAEVTILPLRNSSNFSPLCFSTLLRKPRGYQIILHDSASRTTNDKFKKRRLTAHDLAPSKFYYKNFSPLSFFTHLISLRYIRIRYENPGVNGLLYD